MVKVPTLTTCLLLAASGAASATKINFVNKCATPVQLYHSEHFQPLEKVGDIAPGASIAQDVSGQAHMYRHGFNTDATLAEFSIPNDGKVWYDISVIPPMPGHCNSFEQCKSTTGKRGFNVPLNIIPKTNANGKSCRALTCTADDKAKCADAYHFPDDVKTHDCPSSTEFDVVFCPNGSGGSGNSTPSQGSPTQSQSTQAPPTTQAPTTQAPSTKAPVSQSQSTNTNNQNNQSKDPTKAPVSNNNSGSGSVTYGQCLNPATGKMIAKCDPGFECRNGRCALASAPTAHSNNNNNNQQNNNFGFGNTDLTNTNQGKVSAPSDSVASEATSAPTKSTNTNTNQNSGGASLGKVRATYSYKGKQAGNVPGSYDRVTQLNGCVKQRVSLHSPVGPLSEEVSLVFRGPMDIYNIAVFDASSGGNSSFTRVSSYARDGGEPDNLVFLNNKNVDYSGQQRHGPQGFATADGVAQADKPTKLKGLLKEASNPGAQGAGPGIQTGAEVNIMTGKKCDGACLGYHGANDFHGWGGGRKIFVTKVQMPHGASPNQPAIWMLNAQVLHSNQYGCNCRGMGSVGGCGELDIAEVIETNANRDKVTTHYYFYDGSVLSPGGDNFASRPYDRAVSYATIIDDRHDNGNGLVKIVELEDFDYSQDGISDAQYQQLLDA